MRALVLVVVMAGCSASTNFENVTVTATQRFVTPTGVVTRPSDLSGTAFQVYVANDDGTFAMYPASGPVVGNADGTVLIPTVYGGRFLLKTTAVGGDARYAEWTEYDDAAITWTDTYVGRIDAVPAVDETPLELDATGLAPWGASDTLVADCWGNGTEVWGVESLLAPPLGAGATEIDATFPWSLPNDAGQYSYEPNYVPYLMNPAEGDTLVVSRSATATLPAAFPATTSTLTQVMNAPGVAQVDGSVGSATGTFTDVPATSQVAVRADLDQLAAMVGTQDATFALDLTAGPATSDELLLGPSLASISASGQLAGALDTTLPYGDPFDPSWPAILRVQYEQQATFAQPDGRQLVEPLVDGNSEGVVGVPTSYTFEPLAPASAITVDGGSSGARLAWDGASAVEVAATLPAGATGFRLFLEDFAGDSAQLGVIGSSVALPPELFVRGQMYFVEVEVDVDTPTGWRGSTATAGPFVLGVP